MTNKELQEILKTLPDDAVVTDRRDYLISGLHIWVRATKENAWQNPRYFTFKQRGDVKEVQFG